MLGEFTKADAYAYTVVRWANGLIDLATYPRISALVAAVGSRPTTQAALKAEGIAA